MRATGRSCSRHLRTLNLWTALAASLALLFTTGISAPHQALTGGRATADVLPPGLSYRTYCQNVVKPERSWAEQVAFSRGRARITSVFPHLWQDYLAIAALAVIGLALGFLARVFLL